MISSQAIRHIEDLSAFVGASPSPFHAVATAADRLLDAGFLELSETEPWPSESGRWFVRRGGAIIAWSTEGDADPASGFRIIGAHTDSPNLRIRPRPDRAAVGFRQLGVDVYGGVLLNSWLDRDLGLSGRVAVRGPDGSTQLRLFRCDEPILRLPQLAIHLDRQIGADGLRLDPQRHMVPVWGTDGDDGPSFRQWLADRLDVSVEDVLSWDAMAHDLTAPSVIGVDSTLFASARIDNLLSCHAAVVALIESGPSAGAVPMLCLFDHEEVGSETSSGAAGSMLSVVIERIAHAAGLSRGDLLMSLARSVCVSADGAHATHPNWIERHEPDHLIAIDGGPVLKHNVNGRYATDARGAGFLRSIAADLDIPLQDFVTRGDMPCGSTIGPVTSARLGIITIDVGVAQLSMHSAREMCGVIDPHRFEQLLEGFLTAPSAPPA